MTVVEPCMIAKVYQSVDDRALRAFDFGAGPSPRYDASLLQEVHKMVAVMHCNPPRNLQAIHKQDTCHNLPYNLFGREHHLRTRLPFARAL